MPCSDYSTLRVVIPILLNNKAVTKLKLTRKIPGLIDVSN